MKDYRLGCEEVYQASARIWSFKKVDDIVNGVNLRLSNMAGGFPFECAGVTWADSERLYLCGEFSHRREEYVAIQRELCSAKSGYAAKRFIKAKYRSKVVPYFDEFRLQWMLFCVWAKCKGNADFRQLLLSIPDEAVLVENTTTDTGGSATVWGCKNKELTAARKALAERLRAENAHLSRKELAHLINVETNKLNDIGEWRGQNNIGKILMICRDCLRSGTSPDIDYDLLNNTHIYLFGKELRFGVPCKCQQVIDEYAARAESLEPLVALRHLTWLYMEECGVSVTLRTVIYEAAEFWLIRLFKEQPEWRAKFPAEGTTLMAAMPLLHEQFDAETHGKYDICGMNAKERREATDYMVGMLTKTLDLENNLVEPYDEEWLQAFCWGANKRFQFKYDFIEYAEIRI